MNEILRKFVWDWLSFKVEGMYLKVELQIFWKTCGVQLSLMRFTLKRNSNIIFADRQLRSHFITRNFTGLLPITFKEIRQ